MLFEGEMERVVFFQSWGSCLKQGSLHHSPEERNYLIDCRCFDLLHSVCCVCYCVVSNGRMGRTCIVGTAHSEMHMFSLTSLLTGVPRNFLVPLKCLKIIGSSRQNPNLGPPLIYMMKFSFRDSLFDKLHYHKHIFNYPVQY